MKELEYVLPGEIEKRSFEIIGQELKEMHITIPADEEPVTKRVIHTSADFEYAHTMTYSKNAVQIAKQLIANGADIVTDTNMALFIAGGCGEHGRNCFYVEQDGAAFLVDCGLLAGAEDDLPRLKAAQIQKPVIFAVGNAPTALVSLYELMQKSDWRPAFIIGVPVGFVNVEAAKELILETDVPHIVNRGRKGGSNVAAAIVNAILYELGR